MKKRLAILAVFALAGCAGSIFSHKPYHLQPGMVVESSPHKVVTVWPKQNWYVDGDGYVFAIGDEVYSVCPETVPQKFQKFTRADLSWDKARKCWKWAAQ